MGRGSYCDGAGVSERFVVISGCSGGGKSTLLAALAARGFATVEEPGRRIVAQELAGAGRALPWVDMAAFARRAMALALEDRARAGAMDGWVFFDRGLVDAAVALGGTKAAVRDGTEEHRYHRTVFLTPPWREIYVTDPERQHGFDDAVAEYERLGRAYPALGYEVVVLPKTSVSERVDFVLERLGIAAID
ncbi:MAG: AAA family ATPase [Pelagibacterium sp.]|uniref:AAA family ATPase n=1 Tax=Pelagibacterium sp. TaxID=1967288 RepID=UPI0032EEE717